MWFKIGKAIVVGYGILLTLAAGGFVCANLAGFVRGAFLFATTYGAERAPDASPVQTWTHSGWVLGVVVALTGVIVKMRRKSRKKSARKQKSRGDAAEQNADSQQITQTGRRLGFLASTALGGLGGSLVGGMFGATLILLWFSLTYSPFAPQGWGSSVSVERRRVTASGRREPVLTTDHPVAVYAFGIPFVLGGIAGAVFGGVGGVYVEK